MCTLPASAFPQVTWKGRWSEPSTSGILWRQVETQEGAKTPQWESYERRGSQSIWIRAQLLLQWNLLVFIMFTFRKNSQHNLPHAAHQGRLSLEIKDTSIFPIWKRPWLTHIVASNRPTLLLWFGVLVTQNPQTFDSGLQSEVTKLTCSRLSV